MHGGNAQADTLLCGDVWNHADVAFHGGVCDWISGVLAGSTLTLILVNACSLGRTLDAQVKSFILYILHAVQSHSLPPTLHSTECLKHHQCMDIHVSVQKKLNQLLYTRPPLISSEMLSCNTLQHYFATILSTFRSL